MDLKAYKKKIAKTLKKENRIYDAIIEDIYFVSKNADRKHLFLMLSASLFMIGFALSLITLFM